MSGGWRRCQEGGDVVRRVATLSGGWRRCQEGGDVVRRMATLSGGWGRCQGAGTLSGGRDVVRGRGRRHGETMTSPS